MYLPMTASAWERTDLTHEPIEQLAMLRAMPNFHVYRPADALETAAAWYSAVSSKDSYSLVLTRQNLPQLADPARRH